MTRDGAERALAELEIHAYNHEKQRCRTMVQGRWLDAIVIHSGQRAGYHYQYDGKAIAREVALTILENR